MVTSGLSWWLNFLSESFLFPEECSCRAALAQGLPASEFLSLFGGVFKHVFWWPDLMHSKGDPPLPLPPDLEAFKRLIASCGKRKGGPTQKFVKKVNIPSIELLVD